jgi:hypothetical protein
MNFQSRDVWNEQGSTSGESTSDSASTTAKGEELPPWAEALVYVSKFDDQRAETYQFPQESFSEQFLLDIACNAIPSSVSGLSSQDSSFIFRVERKIDDASMGRGETDAEDELAGYDIEYFFCYVSYRHRVLSSSQNKLHRHAVVLISKWSYPQLAFSLLNKLEEGLFWQSLKLTAAKEITQVAVSMMMVAFGQVMLWPDANADSLIYLPFLGEMLQYNIVSDVWRSFYGGVTLLPSQWPVNLVALFGPFGLLHHTWAIWEMLVTGKDIIVYGTSQSKCSEVVIALATMLAPLHYIGVLRPSIVAQDSDINSIRQQLMKNQQMKSNITEQASRDIRKMSSIIGTVDAKVVDIFNMCDAAIFLNSPAAAVPDVDMIYLGMRRKHVASFVTLSSEAKNSKPLSAALVEWTNKGRENSMIVSFSEPSAYNDIAMVKKIKHMATRERLILGEKLLRDNLRAITLSYLKPSDDMSAEMSDIKAADEYKQKLLRFKALRRKILLQKPKATGILGYLDELATMLRTSPELVLNNIPTVIMWAGFGLVIGIYYLLGLPLVALIAVLFVGKIPLVIPPDIEELLQGYIPESILYPLKKPSTESSLPEPTSSSITTSSKPATSATGSGSTGPVDLSGVWKRSKCINYENFLGAQGVGYVQRRLAANINMLHTITMDSDLTAFRLQEKAGPIDSDNLYEINAKVEKNTLLGKKEFVDKVFWDDNGVLTIVKTHIPEKDYELTVKRYLEDNGKVIRLVAVFRDLKASSAPVETICYFEKTGACPNEPPASHARHSVGSAKVLASPKAIKKQYTDFTGIWQRVKAVNFEEFIGVQGAGFLQRKIAASMPLTHTIVMDKGLQAFRLKETGGPLDLDNAYTIGNDFVATSILKKDFKDKVFWMGSAAIVLHRLAKDSSFELIMTRRLYDDGNQIILTSIHRDLRTMKEVEATSWFNKVSLLLLTIVMTFV